MGSFGRAACFSLHPLKTLNVWGDGGVVVTNSDEKSAWVRKFRNHGMADRNTCEFWGVNSRLDRPGRKRGGGGPLFQSEDRAMGARDSWRLTTKSASRIVKALADQAGNGAAVGKNHILCELIFLGLLGIDRPLGYLQKSSSRDDLLTAIDRKSVV